MAATGLVAYRTGAGSQRQLTWVDRSGTARGTVGDPDGNVSAIPACPPTAVAWPWPARCRATRTSGCWTAPARAGSRSMRLTTRFPSGRPTARGSCSARTGRGQADLYQKLTSGAGVEERLVASDQPKVPTSWSADGRFLLYHSIDPQTSNDLWVVPMVGDHTPSVFLKTPFREGFGAFSPDGRWVAYMSNESGRTEIYVRPFVPPGAAGTAAAAAGGQWQVSTAGGIHPVWRPDGKELYYLNPAGAMMAAPITVTGATLEPGAPVVLFPTRIVGGGADAAQGSAIRRRPRRALPHQHGTGRAPPRRSRCCRTGIPRRRSSPRAADKSSLVGRIQGVDAT